MQNILTKTAAEIWASQRIPTPPISKTPRAKQKTSILLARYAKGAKWNGSFFLNVLRNSDNPLQTLRTANTEYNWISQLNLIVRDEWLHRCKNLRDDCLVALQFQRTFIDAGQRSQECLYCDISRGRKKKYTANKTSWRKKILCS